MAEATAVCTLCKLAIPQSKPKYRLQQDLTRGGGPTELYRQLRSIAGADLPTRLRSDFLCLPCRGSVITAAKQKERFEQSRREIIHQLHSTPAPSMVRSPSRLPSRSHKRPLLSPLATTGVSPLAKRPPSSAKAEQSTATPVSRRELFPTGLSSVPDKDCLSLALQPTLTSQQQVCLPYECI